MKRDYILIIGAMKSGTTTLFDILADHPAIAPASNKEPGFFAFPEIWEQGFDWFDTLFEFDPAKHKYRLEASTDYTKAPFVTGVWERMTANPDVTVKLLYIMRHPLRRLESHARHVQTARKEIGQQISERPDHGLDAGLSLLNLTTSRYADQLDHYGAARAAGNLHCLTLEDLSARPEETLSAVYSFLGLDPVLPAANGKVRVSNAAGVRSRPGTALRLLSKARPLIGAGKVLLPKAVREKIKDGMRKKVTAEGRFRLSDTEEAALLAQYEDDLDRLRQDYGIDTKTTWDLTAKGP